MTKWELDLVIIGGSGHVGLPLSIMFASRGLKTAIFDVDEEANKLVNSGLMPFIEPGAEPLLQRAVAENVLVATADPSVISKAENVVIVIGTPVDEHLNPDPAQLPALIKKYLRYFRDGQLVVLRSTIFPGVTRNVSRVFSEAEVRVDLAFCPERIAEHKAIEELQSLPQIVSAVSERGEERASRLFGLLTQSIQLATPEEAELAKLFTNTWRYIKFAAANQFYMMAASQGLDFERIRRIVTTDYPRAQDMPSAGLAAGPCLLKDTMQLAAFTDNNFVLGHSAMMVNEGLPLFMVRKIEETHDLKNMTVGILGMSFKAGSDDIRSSLSYKLKGILEFRAKNVICTDPFVAEKTDNRLVSLDRCLSEADLLILATPHEIYRRLEVEVPILDIWGFSDNPSAFRS